MIEIDDIVDKVELRTWAKGQPCTYNELEDDLKSSIDDGDYEEDFPQYVMDEIQKRQRLLGAGYPFECDGYSLRVRPGNVNTFTYLFCLALSWLPPELISNHQREFQFETVAMHAARNFFGGKSLRIGAPLVDPATYEELCDRVIGLIPDLGLRSREAASRGDAGWDVLVVKSFGDGKFPRLIVLGNCATGRTNWLSKAMETAPGYFWESFTGEPRSAVITFFAVPYIMDEDARLRKLYALTISFDRFRICEHAPESSQDVADWVESRRMAALEIPFN
jgi:hypothetical protein